jgi:1-aminocyclopropane-1-carboxylate deaminase/D-cysteine desulfhydrase-like pyridoxal-dependent ACC family enzyme
VKAPTPVEEMSRLRRALGSGPRLLVKRDDAIPFGFGGNKVRKLALVAAQALAAGADTLVTTGGVQSNHCRATAAAAAKLGLGCHLVVNGTPPARATANALLDALYGATLEHVLDREARAPALERAASRLQAQGRRPFLIPLGASTPLGALAYALALDELAAQGVRPDAIVHASSSGGTQAGLLVGAALLGVAPRIVGVSADEPAPALAGTVDALARAALASLVAPARGLPDVDLASPAEPVLRGAEVDDRFVGDGYGIPTAASREAAELAARLEALVVDHTYTAKALAAVLAAVRTGEFVANETVLFWHTGGQVGVFA